MATSLEDLKAEVAAAEAAEAHADENTENENENVSNSQLDNDIDNEVADEDLENNDEEANPDQESSDESDVEDWMKSDSHKSQAVKKFTDGDIGKAKAPLKAKLVKQDSEIETLRQEIERLKSAPAESQDALVKPKRDDFYDDDDPDEAFTDALLDWKIAKNNAEQAAKSATTNAEVGQRESQLLVSQKVDEHYVRAEKLAVEHGIEPEVYQASDLAFRQSVETVFSGRGEAIADMLISTLGDGSEKVIFNIGANTAKRNEFMQALRDDPNGLMAMAYLGGLKAELHTHKKRKSNAPAPVSDPNVDSGKPANVSERKLKDAYKNAEKTGDMQAMFDVRSKARAAGVKNLNSW